MKYVAAYLLAGIGGKTDPSVSDLESILGSIGADFQKDNAEKVVKLLNGKDIEEVISTGLTKLASVPSGGAPAAQASSAAAAPAAAAPVEDKKKKEEPKEESDEDMGFGLFD